MTTGLRTRGTSRNTTLQRPPTTEEQPQTFYERAVEEGLAPTADRLEARLTRLFRGVPLRGRRVLDVGGGSGLLTLYAAARGATKAVCVEPAADGSGETPAGARNVGPAPALRFLRMARRLGLANAHVVGRTFQAFRGEPGAFDVIVLYNSINHLDEAACVVLHRSSAAKERYLSLFRKLARLAAPGADLVVADCSRRNLWPDLRLPHPVSRSIEWHKHHTPRTWTRLLATVGWERPRVRWDAYDRTGRIGGALLGNRLGAYLTTGHFRLYMRRGLT